MSVFKSNAKSTIPSVKKISVIDASDIHLEEGEGEGEGVTKHSINPTLIVRNKLKIY